MRFLVVSLINGRLIVEEHGPAGAGEATLAELLAHLQRLGVTVQVVCQSLCG